MCKRLRTMKAGRTMAYAIKNVIVLLVVWTANLALTCPDSCRCSDDIALCNNCPYEPMDDNNISDVVVNICCDLMDEGFKHIFRHNSNKTYSNITIINDHNCNFTLFTLVLPDLKTTTLTVRNNSIINFHVLVNETRLKSIDLSHNKIEYLHNGTFKTYVNLQNLKLNCNGLKYIPKDSFVGLKSLQYLDLSENKLMMLTNTFYPLKNLQHLNLSRNNLEYLSESSFDNGLLQHLDVSHNRLTKVAAGALQSLPNLARLLLADNPGLGTTQLDGQLLVGTGRRLQQVDVSRTGLYQIPEAFTHSVRFLSLGGNKISSISCGDLDSYPLLQSLDFTDNKIHTVEEDSFGRLEMLIFLNLNANKLLTVPKMLPDELKYLSINNNSIKNLTIPDFNSLPNLRILLLQNNGIAFIQENVFAPLTSLEVLDLSNNPIQILTPSTFNGPISLRDLRLCYLNVSLPERDVSFPVPSPEGLQMLHLQSSPGLARQLLADSAVLAALSHLQYLDLRMNHLTDFRSDLIFYLAQLRTLRLHGNNINCSSVDWLREWMTWDQSTKKNETCYFSVQNGNEDENRYNCSFSESFTINDSLPPVSLYSTEMINKLLSYYGYLNNKTELNIRRKGYKHHNNKTLDRNNKEVPENAVYRPEMVTNVSKSFNHSNRSKTQKVYLSNEIEHMSNSLNYTNEMTQKDISSNEIEYLQEYKYPSNAKPTNDRLILRKTNFSSSKSNTQMEMQDGNNAGSYTNNRKDTIINPFYVFEDQIKEAKNISKILNYGKIKNKTGKTVNRAINRNNTTTVIPLDTKSTSTNNVKISAMSLLNSVNTTATYDMTLQDKGESSPFQAKTHSYENYVGVITVLSLITICLVLWASLRLRYRQRRRRTNLEPENLDHIEVASISGGVLW